MPTTYFSFDELSLIPPDADGYESELCANGTAHINYSDKSRNWHIAAVEINHSKLVFDKARPEGEQRVLMTRKVLAPPFALAHLVRALSSEKWRSAIQDHVDEVCAEEVVDENRYADMAP